MGPPPQVKVNKLQGTDGGSNGPLSGVLADTKLDEELDAEEENRADCQDSGDTQGEAVATLNMAHIYLQRKQIDKARRLAGEARNLFRECSDKEGESVALELIANIWHSVSSYEKAATAADIAREQMKRISDQMGEWRMLFLSSQNRILPLTRGSSTEDVNKAQKATTELLDLSRKLNDQQALGSALCISSQMNVYKEKYKGALEHLDEALEKFTAANDVKNMASARLMEARIHFTMNALTKSRDAVQEALKFFRSCDDEEGEKACLELISKLREFDFRVDSIAAPLQETVGQKVRCGALEWASRGSTAN